MEPDGGHIISQSHKERERERTSPGVLGHQTLTQRQQHQQALLKF